MDADERRRRREVVEERRQLREWKRQREELQKREERIKRERFVKKFREREAEIGVALQPEKRRIESGARIAADAISKDWVCGKCGRRNECLRLLLCNLALPVCGRDGCDEKVLRSSNANDACLCSLYRD